MISPTSERLFPSRNSTPRSRSSRSRSQHKFGGETKRLKEIRNHMQVIESILQSYIPIHLSTSSNSAPLDGARLDMLTHQPLNTHQGPIPNFGIIMTNQLDQSRFTLQIRDCLLSLVASVSYEFPNILRCNRQDNWVFGCFE